MTELCNAMGINTSSLYAAFGNKARLFMESVQYYNNMYWDALWEELEAATDLNQALRDFFHNAARILTSQQVPCGCIVISGTTNVSAQSQDLNEEMKALREGNRKRLLHRLERGVQDGHLSRQTDIEALAFTLNAILEGMSNQARDGVSCAALKNVASTVAALLQGCDTALSWPNIDLIKLSDSPLSKISDSTKHTEVDQ
jgi:AcrR family transcriptional regulator